MNFLNRMRLKSVFLVIFLLCAQFGLFISIDIRIRPAPFFSCVATDEFQEQTSNYAIPVIDGFSDVEILNANGINISSAFVPSVSGGGWKKGSIAPSYWNPPTTTYLSVDITIPDDNPGSEEFYYILLSCIDSNGNGNQVGFSADYGHWGLTWCYTTHNWYGAYTYYYDPSAVTLTPGNSYRFEMFLSNGYLYFQLVVGGWTDWTKSVHTGANHFILNRFVQVGIYTYPCFTNYEEVFWTDATTPNFNFRFQNTQTLDDYWDSWIVYSARAPAGVG